MSSPVLAEVEAEGRYPTVLGFLTAVYFVSVVTMSAGKFETSWVPQVVGVILSVAWLVIGLLIKGQPLRWSWPISLFFLYVTWVLTGLLVTTNVDYFILGYTTQIKVTLITWVCFQCVKTRRDILFCFLLLGFTAVFVLVQGLDDIIHSIEYAGRRGAKVREGTALLTNANHLGEFGVAVMVGATACIMGYKNTMMRLISSGFILITLYIIAASGSRTAMFGVVAFAAAFYWFHFRKAGGENVGKKIVIVFLSLFLLGGSVLFITKLPFFFRLQEVFSSKENLQKEPRVAYFFNALETTAEHPVFGLGLGGFALAKFGVGKGGMGQYSHSTVSETLSCTGIPGFLIYFSANVAIFKILLRTRKLPLPKADATMVNVLMSLFWVFMMFTVLANFEAHRLYWPMTGAMLGYAWNLNQKYSQTVPRRVAA